MIHDRSQRTARSGAVPKPGRTVQLAGRPRARRARRAMAKPHIVPRMLVVARRPAELFERRFLTATLNFLFAATFVWGRRVNARERGVTAVEQKRDGEPTIVRPRLEALAAAVTLVPCALPAAAAAQPGAPPGPGAG